MNSKKLLILSSVWLEPESTGAGKRMLQLVLFFLKENFQITYATYASESENEFDLKTIDVTSQKIKLNDDSFDDFLKNFAPDVVLFDRFFVEEQFGWKIDELLPNAIKILDTEDLHFLRQSRYLIHKEDSNNVADDLFCRELASIYRCDLSLIISQYEFNLLQEKYGVCSQILMYLPFLFESNFSTKDFDACEGFMFIGNFLHKPNVDAVQILKKQIWPAIFNKRKDLKLFVYGAYPTIEVMQMDAKREHFFVMGRANDSKEVFLKHKILLAPLQFGAGLKSKLIESMFFGTPSITTSIGAEGISNNDWNGFIEDDFEAFSKKAILLYDDKKLWETAQNTGFSILKQNFDSEVFEERFSQRLDELFLSISSHRQNNFIGLILKHQTLKATKYMSKWITEKNKNLG